MTAGKKFTVTWQAVSKSISGDWIGLFVQNVYSASWSTSVTAGITSGTVTATMPNYPGTHYILMFVRNGGIISSSSLILCTSTSSDASAVEFISTHDSKTASETADPTLKGEMKVVLETEASALKDTPIPKLKNMKGRLVAPSPGMKAKKYV